MKSPAGAPEVETEMGDVFSITLRVEHRRRVFADLHFGRYCIGYLCALRHIVGHPVFAYCLMPDHVHLLVVTGPCGSVEGFVRQWKAICTLEWRRRTNRGSFWQQSAHDRIEPVGQGVQELAQRVLENPVRSGLVSTSEDYPLCGSFERWAPSSSGRSGRLPAPRPATSHPTASVSTRCGLPE